ncbi:ricin-type beta-trefoil lectin domain protein [Catenulispora pinisilvae]|uniref:ricin-type beta-trefoil lectin domain protein n=1 Tax=Catenulispora pinisilvae TaxID=2705253 RepID=UPI001890F927|nr:ricin-type beta-trefoil lectin domain protein [Catenulispora pinisilvae]
MRRQRQGQVRVRVWAAAASVALVAAAAPMAAGSTARAGTAAGSGAGSGAAAGAGTPARAKPALGGPWTLSTTDPTTNYAPTFIGNGYLAARVPAEGTGFSMNPIPTESELAGFYSNPPAETSWSEIRGSLPTWTTLGLTDGGDSFGNLPTCGFDELCEAAAGRLSGGATPAHDHNGAAGGLFVAGLGYGSPEVGSTVTVPVAGTQAGPATVAVRYANGNSGNETVSFSVDGAAPQQVSLPSTGSWDSWNTLPLPTTLNGGTDSVSVSVGANDSGQVNLDTVAVYPAGATAPTTVSQAQAGTESGYKQTLDMSTGTLTTSFTWTAPSGRTTDFAYTVNSDQSDAHVGMVTMAFTPHWSGSATVVDALDGRGVVNSGTSAATVDGADGTLTETDVADGTGVTAAVASVLRTGGSSSPTATSPTAGAPASQSATMAVASGTTYTATKFVGVAATDDGGPDAPAVDPQPIALSQATAAANAGAKAVTTRNDQAWSRLWNADIAVPGDDALTGEVRASMFYLLESSRADVPWSMPPGGLSSDGYNGHVFWDMDTWMNPALLAQHPDISETADGYRQALLGQADQNSSSCAPSGQSVSGARYPWESALTGKDTYTGAGAYCDELHISSDVALAQWQYYLASGDTAWLSGKAWPVLRDIATFWASRAVPDPNAAGSYQILDVMPPDEYHDGVNDSAYTDVAAQTVLRIAAQAAQITGNSADPAWTTVADGLVVPFDSADNRYLEYDGYPTGQGIKQADVTMLQYPWAQPMTSQVAQNDLDYYTSVTDINGPSMTDSVASIDASALGGSRCDSYTYLKRSVDPFMGAPFDQFHETRGGGAFTFDTAAGGFLQEFEYGFTGLRWNADAVQLDPSLPPQLPGLNLTGLQWHGTTYSLSIRPGGTTITVTAGPALPVSVAGGATQTVSPGSPATVATRTPTTSSNAAACKPVTASNQDPSYPAEAAIDGSPATAWHATAAGANLTVDLGTSTAMNQVQVQSDGATTAYSIEGSNDGSAWTTLAVQAAIPDSNSTAAFPTGSWRYLRYQADPSATAQVSELVIGPPGQQIRLASAGWCTDDRGGAGQSQDPIQAYACNGTGAQAWTALPDGTIRATGRCLDVQGGQTGDGTLVQLYDCDNTGAQSWKAQSNGELLNPQSGRCLTNPANGGSGTQLDIEDCNGGADQTWTLRASVGPATGLNGLCLDDRFSNSADDNPVQAYTCNTSFAQQWNLSSKTLRAFGKCLDITLGGTASGTPVDLYRCNQTGAQLWEPQPNGELLNPQSGRCLTDPGSGGSGTQLDVEDCSGAADQVWGLP